MPTSTLPPPKRRNRRQLPFVALLTFLLLLLLLFSSKIQKICDDIKIIGRSSSNELNHQRRLRGRTIPTSMTAQSEEAQTVTYLPPPVQGNADYRNYKAIKLQNGITALLTQDAQSKHFAAAVSVNAGASSDPRYLPGLAHFTEHMCFLGSKRYPEENEYKHYLAQHGGKSNASTSMSHTTYQFDILAEFGEHALDIFSNFFVAPLFTRSGTAREVQAVDSENSKNLVSDGRRRLQVLKALADKDHHYSKFSTGNRITLPACAEDEGEKKDDDNDTKKEEGGGSDDDHPLKDLVCSIDGNCDDADMAEFVRIALLAFHRQHYRPDNMTVVVVGPQTVDELEKWVVPRFGMIADRSANDGDNDEDDEQVDDYDDSITPEKKEKWQKMEQLAAQMIADAATDAPPVPIEAAKNVVHHSAFRAELQGGKWPVVVTTKPLQNVRKLVILFPMPPSYAEPERSPSHLMSHLFGHEGKGSPFALYQNAGWITSLSSGPRISAPDQNLFQITISLTNEGEEHWKDVVKYIFAYAKMLCTSAEETLKLSEGGACQNGDGTGKDDLYRIWEEVGKLDRMQFHQTSPGHVYSFAQSASQSISKYGTTNCLSVGSLLNETRDSLPLSGLLDFCQQIVPSNCFIERCSEGAWEEMEALYGDGTTSNSTSGFAFGKQVEKWYGVEYFVSPLDESDVKLWGEGIGAKEMESIHLPQPNRYIPRSLDLCEDLPEEARVQRIELPVSPPNLIVNEPSGRLWWKLDERYALPKAYLTVLIRTRASENILQSDESDQSQYNTKTSLQSEFLKSIFADALAIETYDAYLAGLGWSLSKSSAGFTLTCHGYSDRLPDLALKLLKELTSPSFLEERHFETAKDKTIRGLSSFFESRRADSLAIYYRNLLLNYKGNGVEENLEIARAITLRDIEKHHAMIWADNDLSLEVLYTGNVSEKQARSFFSDATDVIDSTRALVTQKEAVEDNIADSWASGPLERRLPAGEDIELHFESKNPKEENGAVVVTYQSQHEGFKGKSLSSKETLERSACVRLISKIIREPCFNELRTKQQLGYIVSSFYDMSYSTNETPLTTSIDSLTVYVLSRKVEPKDVAARIDDFLLNFRSKLEDMPSKEIQDYAESLAKELTKPIRKLGTEASNQFGKIRRYAPETLYADNDSSLEDIPFDNAEVVAAALHKLDRNMILDVYDSLIMKKGSRSRILTHVYGRTFPLKEVPPPAPSKVYVSSMNELMTKRKSLIAYEPNSNYQRTGTRLLGLVGRHRSLQYAAAAATVVGVVVLFKGRNDDKKQTKI